MSRRRWSSPILNSAASADFSSGAYTMPSGWLRDRIRDARQALSVAAVGSFLFGGSHHSKIKQQCQASKLSVNPEGPAVKREAEEDPRAGPKSTFS
jgi:hypothetical protein